MRIAKKRSDPMSATSNYDEPSQYLKVPRDSKRFQKLMQLSRLCDCSWQVLALEAIDRLLEKELPPPKADR